MKLKILAELILFTTVRIETDSAVGTGFIITHKWKSQKTSEDASGYFLVTNKHVIKNSQTGKITLTSQSDNNEASLRTPYSIRVTEPLWSLWSGHPHDEIDVCSLPLGPVLNSLPDDGVKFTFESISTKMAPNEDNIDDIGLIEDVLFIGYPNGIYDRKQNFPVARKGITATPPNIDYEGKPIFLIDASVFPGSSGSPVFIYNIGGWRSREALVAGDRVIFLGVLASVFYREEDGSLEFKEIPTRVEPMVRTREMIDLGVVYKARTVQETIEHLLRAHGELPPVC